MNMHIIMNMNIYITKENEGRLRGLNDWTMSGLVNYLLNKWFDEPGHDIESIKDKVENLALKQFPEMKTRTLPKEPTRAAVQPIKTKEDVLPAIKQLFPDAKIVEPLYRDKKNKRL